MSPTTYRIGTLARRFGLTVRTLHHYDAIGLLQPTARAPSGYRLYTEANAERLARIVLLRDLGLGLSAIQRAIDTPDGRLVPLLRQHAQQLQDHLDAQQRKLAHLQRVIQHVERAPQGQRLDLTLEAIAMIERHYTPEQLKTLQAQAQELGPEGMKAAEDAWKALFERFQALLDRGAAPDHPDALACAAEARDLTAAFTGDDPNMQRSLDAVYQHNDPVDMLSARGMPVNRALWDYMGAARAALAQTSEDA